MQAPLFFWRRLEGYAFQPAPGRLFSVQVRRKGEAFPQVRRQSRKSSSAGASVVWTCVWVARHGGTSDEWGKAIGYQPSALSFWNRSWRFC
jgi:hypothetical protein